MSDELGRPSSDPIAVTLDWGPEEVARVRQAAALSRVSFEGFVRRAAEAEAARVLKTREGLMDLTATAEFLGLSRGQVIGLINGGKLRARKVDGEWMVDQRSARAANDEGTGPDLDQIELDLRDLVRQAGLTELVTTGEAPSELSSTWCYVDQDAVLHCPRAAWLRLGREGVVSEARDAVRRHLKRRDRESGKI